MKKTLLITASLIFLVLALSYTLLFTSLGNSFLRPVIEKKINETSPIKVSLSDFVLNMSHLHLVIRLDDENSFLVEGDYSLFSQTFDINYSLSLLKLSNLEQLAQRKLSGQLTTSGNVKGDMDLFGIKGSSNLALSKTDYALVIKDFQLEKAAVKLSDAHIEQLLSMAGEQAYAQGNIDLHVQLNDLDPEAMKGSVLLGIKEASLNAKTLKKTLGLDLKKTDLTGEFRAKLEGTQIDYLGRVNSELADIYSKGTLQTAKMRAQSSYQINIRELALLQSITKSPLRGVFFTEGTINGENKNYTIAGTSNIADSKTSYDLALSDLKPAKLLVHIEDARLEKLLYMTGQSKYAKAEMNADIELNDLQPKSLDGKMSIRLNEGKIDQKLMLKDFDVTLPKTDFRLDLTSRIRPEKIDYTLALTSNLAKISSKGNIDPATTKTKADYTIDIKELAVFKPLTAMPLRGPLATSGEIKGDRKFLSLKGRSDIAQSLTDYAIKLEELKPTNATLNIKQARLDRLLYLAGEPSYAEGLLNIALNITGISILEGSAKATLSKGLMHKEVIKKAFDITLPYTKFELVSKADFKENRMSAKTTLTSNLATVSMKKTDLDIKSAVLDSDYEIFIPFLERLEPILERKLYGELKANGRIKKDTRLSITAHSKIFQGQLNAQILDEKVTADFKDLHAIEVLKMLGYPEVMDAPLNGTFVYDTKAQKGKLDSRFDKAVLTRSKLTDLISGISHTDLTKERFNQGSLVSLIDKEVITSELQMLSDKASLKSKKFIINSKKQVIDARFALKVKKYPGEVLVSGDINAPKVRLDAKSVITPEIEKKVGKEINRFLKKLF